MDESLENAALRELKEETDLDDIYLEQLHTYGNPNRDPRTRVITVAYLALAYSGRLDPTAGDDAAEAEWHSAYSPPTLAFDHERILADALDRLGKRILETPLVLEFLPDTFTLMELRLAYEAVLRKKVDSRTIMRRLDKFGDIKSTRSANKNKKGRLSKYRFTTRNRKKI